MTSGAIEVHVERLVLSGFGAGEAPAIGAALRHEFARLLATPGAVVPALRDRQVERVDAGTLTLRAGTGPETAGRQIAGAVHRGLSQ